MDAAEVHPELLAPPSGAYPVPVVAYVSDLRRGGGLSPHSHERAQLLAVSSGSIAVAAEGATFVAPPERAVWVPADTVHETRHLASTRLRTLYIAHDAVPDLPPRTTVIQISPLMRELIGAIVMRPRLYDAAGADGRVVAVLLDQIVQSAQLPLHLPMPTSPALLALANRILENPADDRDLAALAASVAVSPRTLERQFKAETGLSLRSFRRQAKLLRALELLASGMSVGKVSDEIGFGEPSAFIAMFRGALGVTPGRYLERRGLA